MSEPLPCPFCGEGARLRIHSSGFAAWHVVCLTCAAQGPDVPTSAEAAAQWSQRHAEPEYAERLPEGASVSPDTVVDPELTGVVLQYCRGADAEYMHDVLAQLRASLWP